MSAWWEKTVEYMFVVNYLTERMLMAPLDGNYEALGDFIGSRDDKWVMIEFKRDKTSIKDEVKKFAEPSDASFKEAKAALSNIDGHHFLIFGEKCSVKRIKLKALSYFSLQKAEPNNVFDRGVTQDKFNSYLSDFLFYKFGDVEEGSGGRSFDYSTVLAVNADGTVTHCEGLTSYCERMNLEPKLMPEPTPTPTSYHDIGGPR